MTIMALTATGGAAWWVAQADRARVPRGPASAPGSDPIMDRIVHSGPMSRPRDYFRVIVQPTYKPADAAGEFMSDDEVVLGLQVPGQFRAYPINYLNDHEMVREEIGGVPLLVTW